MPDNRLTRTLIVGLKVQTIQKQFSHQKQIEPFVQFDVDRDHLLSSDQGSTVGTGGGCTPVNSGLDQTEKLARPDQMRRVKCERALCFCLGPSEYPV